MRHPAVLLLLTLISKSLLGQELAILELHQRTAEDLAPLLQSLLNPGDALVPHGTQLIIKADPATLGEIRSVLEQIDQRPHRLRISVRQGLESNAESLRGGVIVDARGHVQGHAGIREDGERQQADQFVQTLDGQPALIETGTVQPLIHGYAGAVIYQSATTGFAVTPRLAGQGKVQLSLEPWTGEFRRDGRLRLQTATTQTYAPLGAWIEIAGLNKTQTRQTLGQAGDQQLTTRIFIKVEDIDASGD